MTTTLVYASWGIAFNCLCMHNDELYVVIFL
jgi:hypothetical protein